MGLESIDSRHVDKMRGDWKGTLLDLLCGNFIFIIRTFYSHSRENAVSTGQITVPLVIPSTILPVTLMNLSKSLSIKRPSMLTTLSVS